MKPSALWLLVVGCLSVGVRADEAPQPQKVALKNVPARLVAFWLDPKHNIGPTPTESAEEFFKRPLTSLVPKQEDPEVAGAFDLPPGIEKIAPDADDKTLLIYGDKAAEKVGALQKSIDFLDQPLRYVEVEARLLKIAPAEVVTLGFNGNMPAGAISFGYLRSDYEKAIARLEKEGKAEFLAEPSLVGVNNFPVRFSFDAPLKEQPKLVFTLTPTINGDGSMTLQFLTGQDPAPQAGNTTYPKAPPVQSIFNLSKESALGVQGFDPNLVLSKEEAATFRVVWLLTAQPVRRVVEE